MVQKRSLVLALVAGVGALRAPLALRVAPKMAVAGEGLDRKAFLNHVAFSSGAACGFVLAPDSVRADAASGVDYKAVAKDIGAIISADVDKGPTLVRLAWHSSGTYDKRQRDGGSCGGTIRFEEELAHGGNAGLAKAVKWLEPVKQKYPDLSYADLFTLAGVVAIKAANGPTITWSAGRVDEPKEKVTPDGRLPDADKGTPEKTAKALRDDVFYRMGFDDREIVVLSGAHALGRCHPDASGYDGPWTPTPTLLTNSYYNLILNLPWTVKQWDGPTQYEDPSKKLMMLPSDLLLRDDPKFLKYTKLYAADNAKFFADFAAAFQKLEELGCRNLTPVDWA